jgi:hypothetical protein
MLISDSAHGNAHLSHSRWKRSLLFPNYVDSCQKSGVDDRGMKVIFYDKFYDIPMRGIMSFEGGYLPFLAEVDPEAEDKRWARGIPAKLSLFPAVPSLAADFEFISQTFRQWKAESSPKQHPLFTDDQYQEAMKRIDQCSNNFKSHLRLLSGLFSNDGESWHFDSG